MSGCMADTMQRIRAASGRVLSNSVHHRRSASKIAYISALSK
jgi:hypothetical protein